MTEYEQPKNFEEAVEALEVLLAMSRNPPEWLRAHTASMLANRAYEIGFTLFKLAEYLSENP